jgi:predicted extracellular nuclease
MRRAIIAVSAFVIAFPVVGLVPAAAASSTLVVNEIDYDQPSTDTAEFLEIKNVSGAPVALEGHAVRLVNGTGGGATPYQTIALPSVTLAAGDYFVVCANAATVDNCDLDSSTDTNLIQNGNPDAVAVTLGETIVDTVSYGGDTGAPYTEGSGSVTDDSAQVDLGISRSPDGTDTDQNGVDISRRCITPGATNTSASTGCEPVEPGALVVNEIDYDQPGTDGAEFLEIENTGDEPVDLDPYAVTLANGSLGGATYQMVDLPATPLAAGDFFVVCANATTVTNCDLDVAPDTNLIQNGSPDAVAISLGGAIVDTVSYEGDTAAPYTEGSGTGLEDDPAVVHLGISRLPDGSDTGQNNVDLSARCITPGLTNSSATEDCQPPVVARIRDIQAARHFSPLDDRAVADVSGIVTVVRDNGFWFQDPEPDGEDATSEGIFVFTGAAPSVSVGDSIVVDGVADEFFPGGATTANLPTTEITSAIVETVSSGNPLPPATVVGTGGRVPPPEVIDDDATGDVSTSGTFDAATDGIDFYESLEGMRLQVNDALAVGPTNGFGEIPVVGDDGADAGIDTVRDGVVISPDDFNPERIFLDDTLLPTPVVNVGDGFTTPVVGVLDYSFGNFKLNITALLTRVDRGLEREVTRAPRDQEIAVATYNVENLDPSDGAAFARHAGLIVDHLRSPDLIAIEEIQDDDGATDSAVTSATATWDALVAAIVAAGGPVYAYRQIDPVDDADGGQPGGNIRVGFLFRTDRGLTFIDRPGGDATTATEVIATPSGPRLSVSPGRVEPGDTAWVDSRKPLVGEFRLHGRRVFVIANHFASKGGDQPLFGRFQPPSRPSEVQRHAQAQVVDAFVDEILAADPRANVIVLGDINDFEFSETVELLEGGVLTTLMDTLPKAERYSYVFEGNSQVLDQILVSGNLLSAFRIEYDPVHVNSEFADQASDHDPQVARLDLRGRPTAA